MLPLAIGERPGGVEVRPDALAVAPGAGLDRLQLEAALGQEVFQAQLGPPRAVDRPVVDLHQKGRADEEMPAGPDHLKHVLPCAVVWVDPLPSSATADSGLKDCQLFACSVPCDMPYGLQYNSLPLSPSHRAGR